MPTRLLTLAVAALAAGGNVFAQTTYLSPAVPPPAGIGGYAVPDQPPPGPAYTLANPVPLPSPPAAPAAVPVWQPYPVTGEPAAVAPGPTQSPALSGPSAVEAPAVPGYPAPPPMVIGPPAWDLKASLIPPDARNGFFQKAKFTATWLPQLNNDSLGWTDLRTEVVTALPFFTRENPIIITPAYEWHLLDRPQGFDLPPRLNDLWMDFHVFRVYENRWIFDFAVTPGLFADDHSLDSSDACRINGRGVAIYAPDPFWKWLLGVQYVNGAWDKIVPIAGFVYEPTPDVKYEAVFPRPRVAWRLPNSPVPGRDDYWLYLLGEFTTSIWAFEQTDGTPDVFAYRDLRFIVGLERKVSGGLSHRVEAGWVFRRDMKIASTGPGEISLDDTLLLRVGVTY